MKHLVNILSIFLFAISCASVGAASTDVVKIEKHIRWLVPSDGEANGVAHSYLVKIGHPAGELIIKHVFNKPIVFFKPLEKDVGKWLYGTQSNAAWVLAEMGYIKALPTLREHLNRDVPKYLKDALRESIKKLENVKK